MIRPPLEVADIVRTYGTAFVKQHRRWLTALHLKVLRAIVACRTAALGGHIEQCDSCGQRAISYNSCPGTEIFHIFLPAPGFEPSTITDFNGMVGVANVGGMGTQTDTNTNTSKRLAFDVDVRFMRGVYVGEDGRVHRNAFAFV